MAHPFAALLAGAANGRFPPADGATDVLPPDDDGTRAVVSFTGHAFVLAAVDPAEFASRQGDAAGGGFGGSLAPALLLWLAGSTLEVGSTDVVLAARGTGAGTGGLDRRDDQQDHPRVRRATSHRRDVQVHGDDRGIVVVGRGLVGRWEMSVELLAAAAAASGAGRGLIRAGLGLIPPDEWCWAQVAAGNARSLRSFLAGGFVAVCGEVLISPPGLPTTSPAGLGHD